MEWKKDVGGCFGIETLTHRADLLRAPFFFPFQEKKKIVTDRSIEKDDRDIQRKDTKEDSGDRGMRRLIFSHVIPIPVEV